jgi:hypothetical protein
MQPVRRVAYDGVRRFWVEGDYFGATSWIPIYPDL